MAVGVDVVGYLKATKKKVPTGTNAIQYAWRLVQWGRYVRGCIPLLDAAAEDLLLEGDQKQGLEGQWWRDARE